MKESMSESPPCPLSLPLLPVTNEIPLALQQEEKEEPKENEKHNVDSFILLSWYCARILFLSEFILFGSAGNLLFLVYAGASPKSVDCIGDGFNITNICTIPLSERSILNCSINPVYEFYSLNVEFEYYCEDTASVKEAISFQMAGILIGSLFWGYFADVKGRRLALIICFTASMILSVANAAVTSLFAFNAVRSIQSFFNGGALIVYGVYMMEHLPRKHRFLISSIIAWSPNYILITMLAWWSGNWRTFQLLIVVFSLPAFPVLYVVYESPRWLIQRGRIEEARVILSRMQEIDGVSPTKREDLQKMIDEEHQKVVARNQKDKNYNVTHLFRHNEMAIATLILSIGVLVTSIISYGLLFNLETLSGSLFLNSIYLGLLRWALDTACGIIDYKFKWAGRKLMHTISQVIVAIGLAILASTYYIEKSAEKPEIARIFTLLSATFISPTLIAKGMLVMEYFPTAIRNSAVSFKTLFSRLGAVIAPLIFLLPIVWLPYALLVVFALVDTLAFLFFLPETKHRPLSEYMPDKKKKTNLDGISNNPECPNL